MPGHGEKQERLAEAAVVALLTCPTIEAAAEKVGIAPRTLKEWLSQDGFRAQYRQARRQVYEGAIGRLQAAAGQAVDALVRNLGCGSAATEVRAALGMLQVAGQAGALDDLAAEVEELRRQLREGLARERGSGAGVPEQAPGAGRESGGGPEPADPGAGPPRPGGPHGGGGHAPGPVAGVHAAPLF